MTQSEPANPDSLRQRFKTLVQQAVSSDRGPSPREAGYSAGLNHHYGCRLPSG